MNVSALLGADWENASVDMLWADAERVFCRLWGDDAEHHRHAFIPVSSGADHPTIQSVNRLAHEYEFKDYLDAAWALRPLELVRERGRTMLVVEYTGGEPLDRLIGHPMEIGQFLRLAIALSAALGRLHGRGLIHKDLNPANFLVDSVTGQVWLTGFGIASHQRRDHQVADPPAIIAGTLAYMAPEQTGRMNRAIDARSDLYALGVILYQMVTGVLPFAAANPMEMMHCHIARQAVTPAERSPGVPAAISAVIMKLLAKTPENRYQTAAGVGADLRRCLAPHHLAGGIETFALAAHDIPDVLQIPEELYGREESIKALLVAFDRVAVEGGCELMLVSGYSGIGKSSVVNELQKELSHSKRIFAAGKCDQFKRNIPYATLAQALQGLVQMILRSSEAELARWSDSIRRALEPNGQIIAALIPELELVIGKQAQVPDLPSQDSRNRFQMVFGAFLQVFAQPEHPLVLFLDDLQWVDGATLALVENMVGQRETRHLLLVGAYRDNEVGPSHPLALALDALRRTGTRVNDIVLPALGVDDLVRLVASALHCDEQRVRPLARLVAEKTGGNPFFAIQFLTELAAEGLLSFDAGAATWTWDVARIGAEGYTDNIVQLMLGKLKRLPAPGQEALKEFACLGNMADLATLAIVRDRPDEQIHPAFRDATKAGLVIRLDSAYRFAHDRVQEAAYELIQPALRAEVHLRIGRRLRAASEMEPTAERLFAVVNQLNHGVDLITDVEEKMALLRLNVLAGIQAKAGIAYGAARDYLAQAAALVAADAWTRYYDTTLDLYLGLAECEYLVGKFDAADLLFELMLSNACSNLDRARIYSLRMKAYQVGNSYNESFVLALEALQLFGVTFPESDDEIQTTADAEFRAVAVNLGERRIADLLDAPVADAPEVRAIIDLLVEAVPSAYNGRPELFPLVVMKAVNFSLRYGNTDQSSYAYAVHALMLVGVHGDMVQAFEFSEMALRLNEKFSNARLRGALLHLHGDHVNFWRRPFATGAPILERGLRACLEVGDLVYAGHLSFLMVWQAIERGDPLEEVGTLAARNAKFARQSHNDAVYQTIQLEQQFLASLRGRTSDPLKFDAAGFDEGASLATIAKAAFGCGSVFHPIMKQILAFLHGRLAAALDAAHLAEPMLAAAMATPIEATHHFYHALTLTALYPRASLNEQALLINLLEDKLKKLKLWADNCPQNYHNRYALVRAEMARIGDRPEEAMNLYEEAIRSARDNGFVQQEAMAFELAAQFYAKRGFDTIAHAYLRHARDAYARWGADGKVQQLDEIYPRLRDETTASQSPTAIAKTAEHLDLATVVRVSEAISGEIVLEKLLDTLMRTAIEHAGAERGLLILSRADEHRIEAEVTTRSNEVTVDLREATVTAMDLPESVYRYVLRTRESVLLPDASSQNPFSSDDYIRAHHARSVLCLPILKQARLLGMLYLENNLTPHAFTPARMAILKLLASEAAISMENARLYRDLAVRERRIRRLVDANIIGIVICDVEGRIHDANDAFLRIVGYDREDLMSQSIRWTDMTPPEWRIRDQQQLVPELKMTGSLQPFEKEFFRKDGSRVPVLIGVANFEDGGFQGVAFVLDLTERKRASDAVRALQMDLAHANRLATMGQLAASIAHEVNQPIGAARNNAHAALRFLAAAPPDLAEVREALECVVNDTYRARDIIGGIRDQVRKVPPQMKDIALNDAIEEVIALVRGELSKNHVSIETRYAEDLPAARGDRVQLQQVILNLILNAIEAMIGVDTDVRTLVISTETSPSEGLLVTVGDSGPGMAQEDLERVFESFYTTKASGVGIGLSICRFIIGAHGGRLWADSRRPCGAVFSFTLPVLD
ncbi:AAA family ATPase [Variovorax sp. J22P240]|uniref:trifunctional serine/threonine-protein kinase/ATP-binding protein/sensor histidine kinase n=1 Tax=Variovorax sp. J22P240 TaxID=3053514 RepID=UPI0025761A83|nr:ATP-binding sensor histidine kinase [Variovorax sp. J22P240]MDM0001093.1 AAA family ATPase [Variovorax sp. J22P240]